MSEQKTQGRDPDVELSPPPHGQGGSLPAVVEQAPPRPQRGRRPRVVLFALLLAVGAGAGIGWSWWQHHQLRLPVGISFGNGRLEADEIDIDTKFAGRIAELRADIGDMVTAGEVVARMDTRDLQEGLKKAQAQVKLAQRTIEEANANLEQQRTQQTLAAQELQRTE